MGNRTSTTSEWEQPAPSSKTKQGASAIPSGREREHLAPTSDVPKVARYIAPQSTPQSRIVVDIRSANLDKNYNVYIRQEPQRDIDAASAWSGLQALGGLCITLLTIQKLWEDIKFIRLLRRELSTLVGSLTDAGAGLDAGNGDGSGVSRPPRSRGAPSPAPASTASPSPAARQLDLHLDELSELLGAAGARGATGQAAETAAGARGSGAVDAGGGGGGGGGGAVGTAWRGAQQQGQQQQQSTNAAATFGRKETTWASISGLMEVKILLQEATVLPTLRPDLFQGIRQPPKALLLFGPPGTGKTLLARAVATESRATFLPVTGSSVLSMWYGQSEQNVKALFEKARKRQPAIIFIDEVDSLLGKRSSGGRRDSNPDKRVTNEFLAFIDGIQTQQAGSSGAGDAGDTRIVVIAATNTPWDLDEAALSRFSRRIYVPLPDRATREALMRKAMQGVACEVADEGWQRLAERCDKYSGRDLVQVCREAAMRPLRDLWGRRLLEGPPPGADSDGAGPAPQQTAAALQRLVDLVANSLAASAATVKAAQARSAAAVPEQAGEGGAGGGAVAAAAHGGRRAGWLLPLRFLGGGFSGDRYSRSKKQTRRELERWKRRHGASWCDVDAVMQQAERLVEIRRQRAAATAAAATASAAQEGSGAGQAEHAAGGGCAASASAMDTGEQAVRVQVRVQSGASVALVGEGSGAQVQVRVRLLVAAGASRAGPAAAAAAPVAAKGAASVPGSLAGAPGAASARAAAAAAAAAPRSPRSASAAGSGGGPSTALSLEGLLSLPSDRVRPVTLADLEAALQMISCTEMDQTAKYTEWDEQYGSGATEAGRQGAGGRNRLWMSMYA